MPKQKCFQLPFKLFKVNVSLSQMSWQTVPQPRTCISKAVRVYFYEEEEKRKASGKVWQKGRTKELEKRTRKKGGTPPLLFFL